MKKLIQFKLVVWNVQAVVNEASLLQAAASSCTPVEHNFILMRHVGQGAVALFLTRQSRGDFNLKQIKQELS